MVTPLQRDSRVRSRSPWGWRQQFAVLLYAAAVTVLVVTLAIAGDPGR
ncbi:MULTISPECIES: hypothetical protein [unclassified Streptomyces]|nr:MULTISPECIES: hypothetical protein [unclassified Streptomyces]